MADFQDDLMQSSIDFVGDRRSVERLRQMGRGSKKEQAMALKTAAEQFENMMMEYWVNGMRKINDTINPDSPLHSKYSSMFEDMLVSKQVGAGHAARMGRGSISYLIAKQFSKSLGDEGKELMKELEGRHVSNEGFGPVSSYASKDVAPYRSSKFNSAHTIKAVEEMFSIATADVGDGSEIKDYESPEDFVKKLMPYAQKAVEGLGFNPLVVIAQAALETGWGKHVPKGNNYFGIKANSAWKGESEALSSPEFENGKFVKEVSKFRKYRGVLESMKDYVNFIKSNGRYKDAVDKSFDPDTYFEEIQKAGYATDPNYADKLKNIVRQIAFMAFK
ncbi:MAG TPA: hypothetical protein DCR21_03065 [Succinivibrionaceae bacterium]|nr:hypothetical protein [Succinivibrionaceae bacterium]